ncbi:hypothetical protein CVT26_013068 [Gymnopilus dilepis]|uniref:Uncharacterized protein n=1 Tax=Gymnopilus dilepis TaxID=231916 RepID=A0A409Y4D0_9AGAR|nr:hypothetical protein CVT26_013068 [Gymnopilus dilepis]
MQSPASPLQNTEAGWLVWRGGVTKGLKTEDASMGWPVRDRARSRGKSVQAQDARADSEPPIARVVSSPGRSMTIEKTEARPSCTGLRGGFGPPVTRHSSRCIASSAEMNLEEEGGREDHVQDWGRLVFRAERLVWVVLVCEGLKVVRYDEMTTCVQGIMSFW